LQGKRAAFCTSPLAPSQRIERCSPDLETGCPPWAARHFAPRTRIELVSLDRQSSCDASRITRPSRSRPESNRKGRLRRPSAGSAGESLGVTYGFRSRRGHVHGVPGSKAPSRHSQRGRNRTCMTSVPSRVDYQYPTRWRTPSESNRALRVFSAALSPVQLGVLRAARGYRSRLTGVKDRRPHLKSSAACGLRGHESNVQ
jgi:hypothetical protein